MGDWIDLTQRLGESSPALPPLHPQPEFEDFATHEENGYNSTIVHCETHCGTHMDAPAHLLPKDEHRTIDEIPPSELVGEGVICDFRFKTPGSSITRDELAAEAERYDLAHGDFLILDCGLEPADVETYLKNFVSLSTDAAEYAVEQDVSCVAIDALSVDRPGATLEDHVVHETLLSADIPIVEGVANLSATSAGRYDVICTPIPYEDRDGAQARVLVRPQEG